MGRGLAGEIAILPAWPREVWPSGRVRGLRARGGLEVDIRWHDGRAESAALTASLDGRHGIRPPQGQAVAMIQVAGKELPVVPDDDGTTTIDVQAGRRYEVTFE